MITCVAKRRKGAEPSRAEQLRKAKRAQRARERERGLEYVQLRLPGPAAEKLRTAMRDPRFAELLDDLLDDAVVRVSDYPALSDIGWNLSVSYLPAREAFSLYERNWRFVEPDRLEPHERALIDRLADRFGGGILHV